MPYQGRQPGVGVRDRFIFTATTGQTSFSGNDSNGLPLKYDDAAYVDVFINGTLLVPVTDYTATTKTSVVLIDAAAADDVLEILAYGISSIADTVSASSGGTFAADVTFATDVTFADDAIFVGNAIFGDNDKAIFGTGSDLELLHDGNSVIRTTSGSAGDLYIKSQGTGHDLYLDATDDIFIRPQTDENGIKVIGNGAVELYHNAVKKFETTAAGVTVTGVISGNGSGLTALPVLAEADQWRLTTTFSGNASPITSNWERNDTSFAYIGTGMSQSSGIYTFPSTGIWYLSFTMQLETNPAAGGSQGCFAQIFATTNNSSYVTLADPRQGLFNFNSSYASGGSLAATVIFDVTNVSTHKVSFGFSAGQGNEKCIGSSSKQLTGITFLKLGNT